MIDIQDQKMAKAYALLAEGRRPTQIDDETFTVPSQTGNWLYNVTKKGAEFVCDCPDHNKREADCKHICLVKLWLGLRDSLREEVKDDKPLAFQPCPACNSYDAVRFGHKDTEKGRKQRFRCKGCGKTFMLKEGGFEGMKFPPEVVAECLDLYFKGLSLRKIAHHIGQTHSGLGISHVMVYYWVQRFARIIADYVDAMKPELGDTWHADEMMVKVKKDGILRGDRNLSEWVWMWNVLDGETRFLIATMVSKTKTVRDVKTLFRKAKEQAQEKPRLMVTDGLKVYKKGFTKVFYDLHRSCTHIAEVGIRDRVSNNRVERLHGTIRERDKIMRAMQNPETATGLLEGFRTYYNWARPHASLGGRTPAEAAGLDVGLGDNKWLGLIKKASTHRGRNVYNDPGHDNFLWAQERGT